MAEFATRSQKTTGISVAAKFENFVHSDPGNVILSTFTLAADKDYSITILSDACANPKASLHEELMTNLFPRSSTILNVDQWIASLPAKG